MAARILVVDDDRAHMTMLVAMLGSWGYEVDTADDGAMAVARVRERAYDVVLTDVRMAEVDGIEALRRIKSYNPYLPVLIMTAYSSVDVAVQALKAGALDYLHKPLDFKELRGGLERALEHGGAQRSVQDGGGTADPVSEMIGDSPPMRELAAMIRAVAPSEASVLILGESGTGKELVAKALHEGSPRKKGRWSRSIARRWRKICSKANSSGMKREPTPGRSDSGTDGSCRPTEAPSFWTR